MKVGAFPQPGTKVRASDFVTIGGGCAANAAIAAARLGADTRFGGPLGANGDPASDSIIAWLARDGVNCDAVVRVDNAIASVSLILLDAHGEKMIATRRGNDLDSALPANAAPAVANIDVLLVDNRFPEFVAPLTEAAHRRAIPVIIDVDMRTTLDDPLLASATHIIASSEALVQSSGLSDLSEALVALQAEQRCFVAVTDGPNGVYWIEDGTVRHMPGFAVDAIDTLGAGDEFHAAFAYALATRTGERAALRFACAAAALKCTRFGGVTGAPTRSEVDAFLADRGDDTR